MSLNNNHSFKYWEDSLLNGELPSTMANRYVVFDTDLGGLNNIRLAFEYVVVLTALTGRTLVMPPASSWYLINRGPMPDEHQGGVTHFGDIYDLDALAKAIPVISTEQFITRAAKHLDIPESFQQTPEFNGDDCDLLEEWKDWLYKTGEIPDWNPHKTIVCMPSISAAKSGPHFNKTYLSNRTPVEFSAWMMAAPVFYFPSNKRHRSLGPVATMLAAKDDHLPTISRRLIKHHIRYRQEIFTLAEKIISALGLNEYDALQVRRNDFQYDRTLTPTEKICDNIQVLYDKQLPIYIATDESDEQIFADLAANFKAPKIISWRDVEKVCKEEIPYAWIGPIEQLICTAARRFVGNDLSTFTSYINRLRGYTLAEDQNSYYHCNKYEYVPEQNGLKGYNGQSYLREHPLFWLAS